MNMDNIINLDYKVLENGTNNLALAAYYGGMFTITILNLGHTLNLRMCSVD